METVINAVTHKPIVSLSLLLTEEENLEENTEASSLLVLTNAVKFNWRYLVVDECCRSKINTFIQRGRIKLIKSDSKDINNVAKDSISNKCCSLELSIHLYLLITQE